MSYRYDICVVGAGLIGSAAAKYLATRGDLKVCLIGPEEPKSTDCNRDIFGQHYDEGRITRKISSDPVWTKLAQRSIDEYRNIERESGVKFYQEVGHLSIGRKESEAMDKLETNVKNCRVVHETFKDNEEMRKNFPYLNFANNDYGIFERASSGHISARKLLSAQMIIASNNGCDIVRAIVKDIEKIGHARNPFSMRLRTDSGLEIYARKVLLSTGSFTPCRNLLPPELDLDYQHATSLVTLLEVSEKDALRLRNMPAVNYEGDGAENWNVNTSKTSHSSIVFYLLPPIKYPDGKYYLKIGYTFNVEYTGFRMTTDEMQKWFVGKGNDPDRTFELAELLKCVVKGITPLSFHPDSCIKVQTPAKRPYIGTIHSDLGIVLGDNGWAAKSSNEIGRLAAQLMATGEWKYDIPHDIFKLRYRKCHTSKL